VSKIEEEERDKELGSPDLSRTIREEMTDETQLKVLMASGVGGGRGFFPQVIAV